MSRPFFLYVPFNAPHGASNLDPKIRSGAQAPENYQARYPRICRKRLATFAAIRVTAKHALVRQSGLKEARIRRLDHRYG